MKLTEKDIGDITMSYRQAADKTKMIKILSELHLISRTVVCTILRDAGFKDCVIEKMLSKKSGSGKAPKDRAWTADEEEKAISLYLKGATYDDIAKVLGKSYYAVRCRLSGI